MLGVSRADGQVRVSVSDSGPGIAEVDRDRVFRPFWSKNGQGTGLGLPIARELAVALGGRLELRSGSGTGSTFDLVLPATSPQGPREGAAQRAAAPAA